MGLANLVMALGLGLAPEQGLAATRTERMIESAKFFRYNAVHEFREKKYEPAATDIMEAFRLFPKTGEEPDWKIDALNILMKYADLLKEQKRPEDRVSVLMTLCSYDLSEIPNGWAPAETLRKEHPDPKKRQEYGSLADALRKASKTNKPSSTSY